MGILEKSFPQSLLPDTLSSAAEKNAIHLYSNSFANQLHLFNGKEYIDYVFEFEQGHPYFLQNNFSVGTIQYDYNHYKDVSLLYNLVSDEVIILLNNQASKIRLIKEKVASFSYLGHTFINIPADSLLSANMEAGYYDILTNGPTTLLARRTKNIQTYAKQKLEYKVFSADHFYIKRNGVYQVIRSKKSLFTAFADMRKEINQYVRQNKIRYRKDPEGTMIRITEYYNQLTK